MLLSHPVALPEHHLSYRKLHYLKVLVVDAVAAADVGVCCGVAVVRAGGLIEDVDADRYSHGVEGAAAGNAAVTGLAFSEKSAVDA